MNILVLNWRSLKDPLSGGAELATYEHAKRWVKNHGANVTWLSPKYNKDLSQEIIDGISFEYLGIPLNRDNIFQMLISFPLFYFLVFYKYLTHYRKSTDVIIDQVHGIPYLTPLYSNKKIVVYIHEVAGEIWNKMYSFPINKIGKFIEKIIFIPYRIRGVHFVTVSKGTKKDLINFIGIQPNNITIVHNGVSIKPANPKDIKKNKFLTIIYLNRLVKMKGIERAIDIFNEVLKKEPKTHLNIVGHGEPEYVDYLKRKIKNMGIENNIKFWGYVDEPTKIKLLRNSHVLINTSYKEGWGLVNIEANTQGTPVVAFNVPGNNESIKNGVSGYICNSEIDMVNKIILIYSKNNLTEPSIEWSSKFDWIKNAKIFYKKLCQ